MTRQTALRLFAIVALAACDGSGTSGPADAGIPVQLSVHYAPGAPAQVGSGSRVRLTALQQPGGAVLGSAIVNVDAAQTTWSVTLNVPAAGSASITASVLVELLNASGITLWSGQTA